MLYRNYCTEALIVVLALLLIAAQPTQAFVGTTPFIYILPENQSNTDAAGWIGYNYAAGSMSDPMGGDWWAHKGLHAGLGCVGAAAQSGDCSSGAFGAVAGEIVAEQIGGSLIEDGDFSSTDKWLVKVGGQSAAIFGADAVGLDYNDANNAAENAIENNVLETLWDIANIAIGSIELYKALKDGDTEGAIAAAIAVGADTFAAILPFVPGGASTVLRATRAAAKLKNGKKLTKAEQAALHAVDKAKAIKAKAKSKDVAPAKRDSDTVMLGKTKNPNYGAAAKEKSYRNFDIPKEKWEKMSRGERWDANKKFLDRAIARGDKIKLSHNPHDPKINTGTFKKEIDHLIKNGYSISKDGKSMIPPSR